MSQLVYSEDELLTDHDYARPHVIGGQRLHGGFTDDGTYQPPRALVRSAAIDRWTEALRERGGDLLDADATLLTGPRCPNLAQHRHLLAHGHGQTFWNGLTTTGKIEARGRALAEMTFPDLQPAVVEDISTTAAGHLNRGLLKAHGLDEGGQPELGIGGHDAMWFAARDLVFGHPPPFPDIEPPDRIGRPESDSRLLPEIPAPIEGLLSFLTNLLVIEFRAEIGFAITQDVLRTPRLFEGKEAEASEAAEIIERIRIDERIHVTSLRLYLGELRQVEFQAEDGGVVAGATLIDRMWDDLVRWATIDQPVLAAQQQHTAVEARLDPSLVEEFRALSDLTLEPS